MSELLPHLAKRADDLCVLTAMQTDAQAHETAVPMFHTGNPLQARPSIGSWVVYGLGAETNDLPGFIAMNPLRQFGGNNHGSAFLPASYQATFVKPGGKEGGDPVPNLATTHLKPEEQRLQLDLLRRMNARRLAQDEVNERARGAHRLLRDGVPDAGRRARPHGPEKGIRGHAQGLRHRLRAAPTALAASACSPGSSPRRACASSRSASAAGTITWTSKTEMERSTKAVDQPMAALLADLKQRGLLEDTLVVWAGEFGRTPVAQFGNGRDHNNRAFTIWMAGGGVKAGFRHGVSDDYGREGVEGRVHVHDLHATILHLLGPRSRKAHLSLQRPDFRLTDVKGNVVKEILA